MPERPDCYGTLFPDLDRLRYNEPCVGKAFTALITSQGIGVHSRQLEVNAAHWEACQRCPAYRSCYDLCLARAVLRHGLGRD
jgi:radical SAM protein with 4Fe4S-binding SPASM domain